MKRTTITAALVGSILAATSCATAPTPSAPARGGDNRDLVVRVDTEGGFTSPGIIVGRVPSFSLFADGNAITQGAEPAIYPSSALPGLLQTSIDPAGVDAIVAAALRAGLAHDRNLTDMGSAGVADATTTVFTLVEDGTPHTVRVYALAEMGSRPPGMSASDYRARRALAHFQAKLVDLRWLPAGSVGPTQPYRITGVRVYVAPFRPDAGLTEPPLDWPLTPQLASFGTPVAGYRCGPVTGRDWAERLGPLAVRATSISPWVSGGSRYGLVLRPLLPGEAGC